MTRELRLPSPASSTLYIALIAGTAAVVMSYLCVVVISSRTSLFLPQTRWLALGGGIALLALAGKWMLRSGGSRFPEAIGALYFALLLLGYWSYETLLSYKMQGFPIAKYQPLPYPAEIRRAFLIDCVAGLVLIYGLWLGRARASVRASKVSDWTGDRDLLRATRLMFAVGLGGATIVVAAAHGRLALFAPDIDAVRFQQGAGIGFASLFEYALIPAIALAVASAIRLPSRRPQAAAMGLTAASVLVLTRAERTPLILAVLASLLFAARIGKSVKFASAATLAALVAAAGLFLGLLRLQSENVQLTSQERQVRLTFDISPELRERGFVYRLYGDEVPYTGTQALLPLTFSVVPGKLLALAGIDKRDVYSDSSRDYSATMRSLNVYSTPKPIRVGLPGELWIDGGWVALFGGMLLFGFVVARLTATNPSNLVDAAVVAVIGCYSVVALIMPLATLAPIALASLFPLLIRRIL